MADWRRELDTRCTAAALDAAVRDDIAREIAEHLEDRYEDLVAGGVSPEEASHGRGRDARTRRHPPARAVAPRASRAARRPRRRSPWTRTAAACGAWPPAGRDLLFGWRSFRRDRAFTAAAVVTLAACLAANLVVFTLVNAVLLDAVDVPGRRPSCRWAISIRTPARRQRRRQLRSCPTTSIGAPPCPRWPNRRSSAHGVSVGDQAATAGRHDHHPHAFPMLRAQAARAARSPTTKGRRAAPKLS
jgi:hypothetical protein